MKASGTSKFSSLPVQIAPVSGAPADDPPGRTTAEMLSGQNRVLQMIAEGAPLRTTLTELVEFIEKGDDSLLCSILLLDPDGVRLRCGAAPRLPKDYVRAIDGEKSGPQAGSCGTAAFRRTAVIVEDIATDPLWVSYRDVALSHGLRACWSTPILAPDGGVLGTFAIYYLEPRAPLARHRELVSIATHVAAIALQRARHEDELRRQQNCLETAEAQMHLGSWEFDLTTRREYWSRELYRIFDRDPSLGPATADEILDFIHPDDREALLDACSQLGPAPGKFHHEFRGNPARGSIRHFLSTTTVSVDAHTRARIASGTIMDITEHKRSEQDLRESEERLRLALKASSHGMFDWNLLTGTAAVSPEYALMLDADPGEFRESTQRWQDSIHPDDRPGVLSLYEDCIRGKSSTYTAEYRVRTATGRWKWVLSAGQVVARDEEGRAIRLMGTNTDITERRELEAQVRHAQKMDSLGQLAGGVAHDFNNLLTVIQGGASIIQSAAGLPEPLIEAARDIAYAADRGAQLTRQLLTLSRRQTLQPRPTDLNRLVADFSRMLERLLGETISFRISPSPRSVVVIADPGSLEQVLMNLSVNARDAMPNGGTLEITLTRIHIDEHRARATPQGRTGDFACLSVRDTGTGIDQEFLPKIFEPFFTTKGPGKGSGLGLATVFGIARQHHGWISVESAIGRGSMFEVFLPLAPDHTVAPPVAAAADASAPPCGTRTILLAEDEEPVRRMVKAVLAQSGYRVIAADSGVAALAIWTRERDAIDLVITDIVMPLGVSGYELARRLWSERPGQKIIFSSGYNAEPDASHTVVLSAKNFLQKPYNIGQLLRMVRDQLPAEA